MSVGTKIVEARRALEAVVRREQFLSVSAYTRYLLGRQPDMVDGLDDPRLLEPERVKLKSVVRILLEEPPRGRLEARARHVLSEIANLAGRLATLDLRWMARALLGALAFAGLALALTRTAQPCRVTSPLVVTWLLPDGALEIQSLAPGDTVFCTVDPHRLRRWIPGFGYAWGTL